MIQLVLKKMFCGLAKKITIVFVFTLLFSISVEADTNDSLLLENFESVNRIAGGALPYWKFYNGDSSGVIDLSSGEVNPIDGLNVLKVTTLSKNSSWYDMYVDFQPWNSQQGDSYTWEKALETNRYTLGKYRNLEFWFYPDPRFNAPRTDPGAYSELSFGTYTMAPSRKFTNNQEGGGYHGYHSLIVPRTNGRWMKIKMMRAGGFRSGAYYPAIWATVSSSNNIPFTFFEKVTSQSTNFTFTNEYDGTVYGLWNEMNGIPLAGETLVGQISGATRTVSAANRHFPQYNNVDMVGRWSGYDISWIQKGGATEDWFKDYPNTTYWDRLTRFYVAMIGQPEATAPSVSYMDSFRFVEDDRDDQVAINNIGAFYDPTTNNLYVTWSRNAEMRGLSWEVRVAYDDIHTNGLNSATVWKTINDSANDYGGMSVYGPLTGTNNRPLYISVRPTTRETFTQIMIPTTSSSPYAATVDVVVPTPVAQASFVKTDTTTQGNWKTAYGFEGYRLAADKISLPSYVDMSFINKLDYTWSPSTVDIRALQKADSTNRHASTWYNSQFSINLDFKDTETHRVSIYILDWDRYNRSAKIQIIDTATNKVLDTQNISDYVNGKYLTWDVKGDVIIKSTFVTGDNVVISGIFFDSQNQSNPRPTPPSPTPLTLVSTGKNVDIVGYNGQQNNKPDGQKDAGFMVTLPQAKTITNLALQETSGSGTWSTETTSIYWVLGLATSPTGPIVNSSSLNFSALANTSFYIFASDSPGTPVYFNPGSNLTLTATYSDGSTGTGSVIIPSQSTLVGDINNDKIVNSVDWSLMNAKWFTADATADLNKDGLVNAIDFSLLNANWFKTQ